MYLSKINFHQYKTTSVIIALTLFIFISLISHKAKSETAGIAHAMMFQNEYDHYTNFEDYIKDIAHSNELMSLLMQNDVIRVHPEVVSEFLTLRKTCEIFTNFTSQFTHCEQTLNEFLVDANQPTTNNDHHRVNLMSDS